MSPLIYEQHLFLRDVTKLLEQSWQWGFMVTGGELHRPPEMQKLYVQTGRSQTMNSLHGLRLAIDLFIFRNGELVSDKKVLQPIGDYWESLGVKNRWGGNWKSFKDLPHFERTR